MLGNVIHVVAVQNETENKHNASEDHQGGHDTLVPAHEVDSHESWTDADKTDHAHSTGQHIHDPELGHKKGSERNRNQYAHGCDFCRAVTSTMRGAHGRDHGHDLEWCHTRHDCNHPQLSCPPYRIRREILEYVGLNMRAEVEKRDRLEADKEDENERERDANDATKSFD